MDGDRNKVVFRGEHREVKKNGGPLKNWYKMVHITKWYTWICVDTTLTISVPSYSFCIETCTYLEMRSKCNHFSSMLSMFA